MSRATAATRILPVEPPRSRSSSPSDPNGTYELDDAAATVDEYEDAHALVAVPPGSDGIRKSSGYEQDISKLNPVHVVIAGVIGALLFIAALALLVNWIIASGVAS